jgi:hypothetical protein
MYVLSCGELDERIALSQQYAENPESRKALVPSTPLTHRQWVPSTSNPNLTLTPVGNAMRSVETLRTVLAGYTGTPEPSLLELLQDIDQSCLVRMQERLEKMSVRFCSRFRMNAQERFLMSEALYYKMVEFIIRSEMKKFKNPQQMQVGITREAYFGKKKIFNSRLFSVTNRPRCLSNGTDCTVRGHCHLCVQPFELQVSIYFGML